MEARRALMPLVAAAALAGSGCEPILGILGPTPTERGILQELRLIQRAVSPTASGEMALATRAVRSVLEMGLPSYYGVDLEPFLRTVPWAQVAPLQGLVAIPDGTTDEISQLRSMDNGRILTYLFNNRATTISNPQVPFALTLERHPEGFSGRMDVETRAGSVGVWRALPQTQPVPGQPAAFAASGRALVLGRHFQCLAPTSVTVSGRLDRQGQSLISGTGTFAPLPGVPGGALQTLDLQVTLPRVQATLKGRLEGSGLQMTGEIVFTPDGGTRVPLSVTRLVCNGQSVNLVGVATSRNFKVDITLQDGKLQGEVRTLGTGRDAVLLTLTPAANVAELRWSDTGSPEPWR
ncbi:MAG: hypothetical protein VKP57_10835 [Candidatus Sericytochromatia bacterium]|nr:hypothetical protein [Candidatus Sericytochromatia bacterium]